MHIYIYTYILSSTLFFFWYTNKQRNFFKKLFKDISILLPFFRMLSKFFKKNKTTGEDLLEEYEKKNSLKRLYEKNMNIKKKDSRVYSEDSPNLQNKKMPDKIFDFFQEVTIILFSNFVIDGKLIEPMFRKKYGLVGNENEYLFEIVIGPVFKFLIIKKKTDSDISFYVNFSRFDIFKNLLVNDLEPHKTYMEKNVDPNRDPNIDPEYIVVNQYKIFTFGLSYLEDIENFFSFLKKSCEVLKENFYEQYGKVSLDCTKNHINNVETNFFSKDLVKNQPDDFIISNSLDKIIFTQICNDNILVMYSINNEYKTIGNIFLFDDYLNFPVRGLIGNENDNYKIGDLSGSDLYTILKNKYLPFNFGLENHVHLQFFIDKKKHKKSFNLLLLYIQILDILKSTFTLGDERKKKEILGKYDYLNNFLNYRDEKQDFIIKANIIESNILKTEDEEGLFILYFLKEKDLNYFYDIIQTEFLKLNFFEENGLTKERSCFYSLKKTAANSDSLGNPYENFISFRYNNFIEDKVKLILIFINSVCSEYNKQNKEYNW